MYMLSSSGSKQPDNKLVHFTNRLYSQCLVQFWLPFATCSNTYIFCGVSCHLFYNTGIA